MTSNVGLAIRQEGSKLLQFTPIRRKYTIIFH